MPQELTPGPGACALSRVTRPVRRGGNACPWECAGRPAGSHRGPTEGASENEKSSITALAKVGMTSAHCPPCTLSPSSLEPGTHGGGDGRALDLGQNKSPGPEGPYLEMSLYQV